MAKKKVKVEEKRDSKETRETKIKAEPEKAASKAETPKEEVFSASGFADRYITSPAKKGMFLHFTKGDSTKRTPREWRKIAEKKGLKL